MHWYNATDSKLLDRVGRLFMAVLWLAVTPSFALCFATADLTENTQRHCEIYFSPLQTCKAATAIKAKFCQFLDNIPFLITSAFLVT